ncbi:MAG: ribosome-associated translation inhibitor RaiA [Lachnospiraceae bacterium]|nr:ribosome-associated translation inhibitor RaiA [Lachnospiraceae bacterium]MBQ6075913.1 ribosome-associated translation inhibitor RaiA [Lachnospiraceae bacterium]
MNFKLTTGKNFTATQAMEELLGKKLAKLDRFFVAQTDAEVFMDMVKSKAKVEITVPVRYGVIRSEKSGTDIYALIDEAVDSMEKQLKKYRGKLHDTYQSGGLANYEPEAPADDDEIKIVRTKRFAVKPMDAEEACLQMELLGHNFYMFLNAESGEVNVVYRRNDGAYGLIEPVLGEE